MTTTKTLAQRAVRDEAREIFGLEHEALADVAGLLSSLTESEIEALSRVMRAAYRQGIGA